jgi:hypothetical protein
VLQSIGSYQHDEYSLCRSDSSLGYKQCQLLYTRHNDEVNLRSQAQVYWNNDGSCRVGRISVIESLIFQNAVGPAGPSTSYKLEELSGRFKRRWQSTTYWSNHVPITPRRDFTPPIWMPSDRHLGSLWARVRNITIDYIIPTYPWNIDSVTHRTSPLGVKRTVPT